jgi:hypothetical protein
MGTGWNLSLPGGGGERRVRMEELTWIVLTNG